jgi:Ca2+-binding EF-hand superfamily protein
MNHVSKITFAVMAAAFVSAYAFAAPNDGRFPISIAEAEERSQERFGKIDTDDSGTVSRDEFVAADGPRPHGKPGMRGPRMGRGRGPERMHRERFRAPGDEASQEERTERHAALRAQRAEHAAKLNAELFAIIDADGDGYASADEFAEGSTRENHAVAAKRAMFAELDVDASGDLTPDEFPSPAERLRKADEDGDGFVTREEMRQLRHHRPGRPA